jgi:pantetheine-phosphate adenylyltransferase
MHRVGMVTGSFDPITNGHEWMTERACKLFDMVYFAIAFNPSKKGLFSPNEREDLARAVLQDSLSPVLFNKISFVIVENEFTVSMAKQYGATILRGIRNPMDFSYEADIQGFNTDIEPDVEHLFVIPPEKYTRISSSAIKGFVGVRNWEEKVARYIHPKVLEALKQKQSSK